MALATLAGCHLLLDIDQVEFGDPAAGGSSTAGSGGGLSGGGGTGGTGGSGGGPGSWYDAAFGYRIELSIDNSNNPEELTDFPLLVVLDESRIDYAHVTGDARDLRFVDDDHASLLDHEVELWAPTGSSYVWVKVPSIPADSTTRVVWMYYGNSAAEDVQNAPGTWSNGYQAVWHLGLSLHDSTGNGHDGTNIGTLLGPGPVAQAREFDGITTYVDIGAATSLEGLFVGGGTVCAWVRPDGYGESDAGRIVDMSAGLSFLNGWGLITAGGAAAQALAFGRGFATQYGLWATPAGSLALGSWVYAAATYDDTGDSEPDLYLDGVPQTVSVVSAPQGTLQSDVGSSLRIGNLGNNDNRALDGGVDEVRLSSVPRSAAWIGAQYRSMTDTMVTYGAEEARP